MCVCVCVCVCVRACLCVRVCVCVRACVVCSLDRGYFIQSTSPVFLDRSLARSRFETYSTSQLLKYNSYLLPVTEEKVRCNW